MSDKTSAVFYENSGCDISAEAARKKFNSLERWLYSKQACQMGLWGVEVSEESEGRELLRLLLQSHIECRGTGDVGPAIRIFKNSDTEEVLKYTHKRIHARNIWTIFGKICVKRTGYRKKDKVSIHPLDEQLQMPQRAYSYELQRRLVKRAVQGPFDEAVESIYEATGVKVPKRSAEEIIIDAGIDFDSFYARRQGKETEETGHILVGSVDCKGIPMVKAELAKKKIRRKKGEKAQKKKMATVAAVFTQKPYIRTPEEVVDSLFRQNETPRNRDRISKNEGKRVWASLEAGKDSFICDVKEEMERRDPTHKKLWVVVTDGERALQKRVCRFMGKVILILDFLHALEKLWAAGHALYGEGSKEAEEFVRKRTLWILQGKVSQVVKGLRQIATKRNLQGSKQKKLNEVSGYFYRNRERMCYDDYLSKGLPIASGAVEGACKNLIKDRMERSGMRWSMKGAEAMVKMRAVYISGDYEEYWNYHVEQEQKRLHGKYRWETINTVTLK